MDSIFKLAFSGLAIALTFVAFVPYIFSILSGATKPHVFSWVIWGTTTSIVFFAQVEAKGGIGAWPIGVSGAIAVFIAFLAFVKRSDISITKTDWVFFYRHWLHYPFGTLRQTRCGLWSSLQPSTCLVLGPQFVKPMTPSPGKRSFLYIVYGKKCICSIGFGDLFADNGALSAVR